MQPSAIVRSIKIAVAVTAYLPMLILMAARVLPDAGIVSESIITGCNLFNLPAVSIGSLIKTFPVSHFTLALSVITLMFAWSSFMAWFFWRAAGTLLGEDNRGKFDWIGFQVRFAIGFMVGGLCGWRFVRYTTSGGTVLIASCLTSVIGGLLYGLSRPPDFWARS